MTPGPGEVASPCQNNEIAHNFFDPGDFGIAPIKDSGRLNRWKDNDCREGLQGFYLGTSPSSIVVPSLRTDVYAYISANQTIAMAGAEFEFDEVVRDALGEWQVSPTFAFIPKFPGEYDFVVNARSPSFVGDYRLLIQVDAVDTAEAAASHPGTIAAFQLTTSLTLAAGDVVRIGLLHTQNPTVQITGQKQFSFLTIRARG